MAERLHSYGAEGIVVQFSARRCIHAAECLRRLPEVFDVGRRPWVEPGAAPADAVAEVIGHCPSGALHFQRRDGGAPEPVPGVNTVRLNRRGPLYLRGNLRLAGPDGAVAREDTRLALCRCGASLNKPYCDNAHLALGFQDSAPRREPLDGEAPPAQGQALAIHPQPNGPLSLSGPHRILDAFGIPIHQAARSLLCRCGGTANAPFCDGTHERNGFRSAPP